MNPELDHIRTGILEDELADRQAVLVCMVRAVETQDRTLWNMVLELARDYAGKVP